MSIGPRKRPYPKDEAMRQACAIAKELSDDWNPGFPILDQREALVVIYREHRECGQKAQSMRRDRFLKRLRQCVKEYPTAPKGPVEAFLVWVEARVKTFEMEAINGKEKEGAD